MVSKVRRLSITGLIYHRGRAVGPASLSINAPKVAPSRKLLLPRSIKSGPYPSQTTDVQTRRAKTNEARTEKWRLGQLALRSGLGKISPWMIFRENIYLFCFVSDWKSIPLMPNYLLAICPGSPCVYWLGLLRAGEQFNPSNNPARTRRHCYIIQDATWTAAEWWDMQPSRLECAFCILKLPISRRGDCTAASTKDILHSNGK